MDALLELLSAIGSAVEVIVAVVAISLVFAGDMVFLGLAAVLKFLYVRGKIAIEEGWWQRTRKIRRAMGWVLATLTLVALVSLALLEVFFVPVARHALARAADRVDVDLAVDEVDGSLLAGRIEAQGLQASRTGDDASDFLVTADALELDIEWLSLLPWGDDPTFERVRIEGVDGTFARKGASAFEAEARQRLVRSDRSWHVFVRDLAVRDVHVAAVDETLREPASVDLTIDTMSTHDLSTRWLAYNLLFNATIDGSLNGSPLYVGPAEETAGVAARRWKAKGVPLELATAYIGRPLHWFGHGSIDVDVLARVDDLDDEIALDCLFVFEAVHLAGDPGGPVEERLAAGIVRLVNSAGRIPIEFGFTLRKGVFEGHATPEAVGLWRLIAEALTDAIADFAGVSVDKVKDAGRRGLDMIKDTLGVEESESAEAPPPEME